MSILNRFRNYSCDIYRMEPYLQSGIMKHKEVLKYSNIPCHLSQRKLPIMSNGEVLTIETSDKVFFDIGVDVLPGDKLHIKRPDGSVVKYTAVRPFCYSRHIEVAVTGSENA